MPLITAAQLVAAVPAATEQQRAIWPGRVTEMAEGHCRRPLALRTFDDELVPDGDGVIRLRTWPVVDLEVFASPRVVIRFRPVAAPGLWRSAVKLRFERDEPSVPSGVALRSTTSGVEAVMDLPFHPEVGPRLATVGALAASVNAGGTWTAILAGDFDHCPTSELRALQSIATGGENPGLVAWTGTVLDFNLEAETGRLTLDSGAFSTGWPGVAWGGGGVFAAETVRVRYSAGYNADPATGRVTVPGDLTEACCQLAQGLAGLAQHGTRVKQVSLGNTSYTLAEDAAALTTGVQRLLARYIDRRL